MLGCSFIHVAQQEMYGEGEDGGGERDSESWGKKEGRGSRMKGLELARKVTNNFVTSLENNLCSPR